MFFIKIVYDWIWKRAPWCQKPELCQQCHKHCHFSNNLKKPGIFIVMQTVEHLIAVSRRHKMCFCVSDLWRVPLNCIAFAHLYKSKTGPIIHRWLILSSCFNLVSNLFQVMFQVYEWESRACHNSLRTYFERIEMKLNGEEFEASDLCIFVWSAFISN